MVENTVAYTLRASTQGLQDLQLFRAELASLKELQSGFRADMGFGQQQRESIKATKVDLSGLEFQILGLTDSIKVLDTTMGKLGQSGAAAGQKTKTAFTGLDPTIAETVRTVRTLLTEFQSGNIKATEFGAGMQKAKAELIAMSTQNSLGTRELQAISGALNIVAKSYGLANSASSPYLAGLQAQRAAMNEVKATSTALNQQILGSRRAWQEGKIDSEQLAQAMTSYGIRANALLAPLEAQKVAILALGVPTKAQSLELERLTGLTNGYSMAAQRAAAGIDAARGAITRGSLAASVQAGTAGLSASLSQATADTKRLMDAERAGLVTKEQYILGLADQTAAHRAALTAIETEMAALRGLGQLDVQQVERLAQLVAAQNGYTAALARTVSAQEAQTVAQRAAAGAALGVRGAGGMNNAAMAAMFVSPELGMAAMAISMGPVIAGAAAVGLFAKAIGDGIDKAAIFQRSLQQIGAISGQSAEQMNQYGSYIQHLSTELPISTQRLAEMGREAVMVGLHGPEGMRVYTETMAAFSVITRDANGNLGHTAEVGQEVVKILRSTGATTEEVTVGFGRMINGLVGLKTESGVAIPQVTALLKFWSSQGHAVGLTIEQMAGLSAALIQTGARAQGAGGAMAKFFDTAESAAATGGAKLQSWANVIGLSTEKTKELLKNDPMEFLRRFVSGAEAMDRGGTALSLTLGSVSLNSAQVRRTFAELVNALPLVTGNIKIMTSASDDQGMAMRKAIDATNDYKDKITRLGQGFDLLKTNMAMAVLPGMTAVLGWALSLSQALQRASEYMSGGLGNAAGIDTTKLSEADKADVELTLKRIDQIRSRTDSTALAEMDTLRAHLAVLKSIADGSLNTPAPWLTTPAKPPAGALGPNPIGIFNGTGPLAPGQVRGVGATESGALAIQASLSRTGDKFADSVVDYCAKWVRLTLDKASPAAQAQINKLFQTDFNKDGLVTAIDASRNADKAGILRKYTKATDLAPGDTVFYTEGGQNHVGIYLGNGMVRGNNRVSYTDSGGTFTNGKADNNGNPFGDVSLSRLGTPSAFVRAADYLKAGSAPAPGSGDASPKSLAAYVTEVERLNAAIDKAAKRGKPGLTDWKSAKDDLKAFTTDNEEMVAQANDWISSQAKATKAALKDMGLSDADWSKYKARATELAGLQDKRSTLSQSQALKLDRDVTSFNSDPVKSKALQFATQQLSDQKALASQTKQATDKATADAARLAEGAAQARIDAAQGSVDKLKQIQSDELANADTAAAKLAIIQKTSTAIYKGELAVAEQARQKAYAAAEKDTSPAQRTQDRATADAAYGKAQFAAALAQTRALNAAQKSQSVEHDKAVKDAAKARADTLKALSEDDVKGAEANLAKLNEIRDRELAADKDNVVKKLATAKDYAAQTYALQVQINQAAYDKAVSEANNGRVQQRPGLLKIAQTNLDAANLAAQNARAGTATQATDAQTSAIQKQRDAYSKLADSLRAHVLAGDLDAQTQHDLTKQFNDLGRETDKLGLTNDKYVKGARIATYALFDQGQAAYLTAQRTQGMVSGNDAAAESALTLATELQGLGDEQGGLDALQTTYDSLTASLANGEASAAEVDKVRIALEALRDSLGTQSAVNDWLSALDGSIDDQIQAVAAKLSDPDTTLPFKKALIAATADLGGSVTPGPMSEAAQQALVDQQYRAIGDASNLMHGLSENTGGRLQATMRDAAAYLTSAIGQTLPPEVKAALQAAIDGAVAGSKSLDEVLKNPEAYADGARGLAPRTTYDPNKAALDLANRDGVSGSNQAMDSTRLEAQHAQGLISEQSYLGQKRKLDEVAALNAFLVADRDQGKHVANLAAYNAQMLGIDQKYNTDKKVIDDKAIADQQAALVRGNQAALLTLEFNHQQQTVSDRDYFAKKAKLESRAADLAYYSSKFTVADWAAYQAELTRITRQGVTDRAALDKAGIDSFISGIESLGSALGGMQTIAGAALTTLGGAAKLSASIPGLLKQTQSAFGGGGTIFDKLGAAGGWLGAISTGIGLIGQLGDAIMNLDPAYQLWKKNTLEQAAAESAAAGSKTYGNIANPYFDKLQADSAALTTKANAGFWQRLGWSIFGGAPATLSKAASDSLVKSSNLFSDYAQSINQSLESELMNAFDSADFSNVQSSLDKMFGKLEAGIALKALISKSNLTRDIQKLVEDTTAGLDTTADKAAVKGDEGTIAQQFQAIAPSFAGYGATANTTTGSTSTAGTTTFGSVPQAVQLAVSAPLMDAALLYDTATKRFDGSTVRFDATVARMDATVARMETWVNKNSNPTAALR